MRRPTATSSRSSRSHARRHRVTACSMSSTTTASWCGRGGVEKPDPAEAPSTLTIIGRYIIQPEIFGHLSNAEPGSGGEIQLTDALAKLIGEGQTFHGLRFEGRRYDCGDKLGFLEATVALGLQHPELGPRLRRILRSYL